MISKQQAGFTLIEALVTGIIALILAGTILTTLHMSNNLISAGSSRLRLNQLQAVASTQIIRIARSAHAVKILGDPVGALSASMMSTEPTRSNQGEILLCDDAWNVLGGYRISVLTPPDTLVYLEEWDPSASPPTWIPFKVGKDTVWLVGPTSTFTVWPRRRGVDFRMHHVIRGKQDTLTLALVTSSVQCRSQTR